MYEPIGSLNKSNHSFAKNDNYQNDFSIVEIDSNMLLKDINLSAPVEPLRMNHWIFVLVKEGFMKISLDSVSYSLVENSFLIILPSHIMQLNKITNDFKAHLIIASKTFLDDCNLGEDRPHSISNYIEIRKNPFFQLSLEERTLLEKNMAIICDRIDVQNHFFHKELIQNAFVGYLLDLANIIQQKKRKLQRTILSHKEEIYEQFLRILFVHAKEQHEVNFYSKKLCITPQYLSLVLKSLTGKTANAWINQALMVEAKLLLKTPKMTVQKVAEELHFSDQSTFGKFFKKHLGITPMQYRRS